MNYRAAAKAETHERIYCGLRRSRRYARILPAPRSQTLAAKVATKSGAGKSNFFELTKAWQRIPMRKPTYIPTSKQGVPEVDAAQFFNIDGIGMELAHEVLVWMKLYKFAEQTWDKSYPFKEWVRICREVNNEFAILA